MVKKQDKSQLHFSSRQECVDKWWCEVFSFEFCSVKSDFTGFQTSQYSANLMSKFHIFVFVLFFSVLDYLLFWWFIAFDSWKVDIDSANTLDALTRISFWFWNYKLNSIFLISFQYFWCKKSIENDTFSRKK